MKIARLTAVLVGLAATTTFTAHAATKLPTPRPSPTKIKPKPTPTPSPSQNLLTSSLTVMKNVHSFHVTGGTKGDTAFNNRWTQQINSKGDCVAKIRQPFNGSYRNGYLKVLTDISGKLMKPGSSATHISMHYLQIFKGATNQIWERSSRTKGVWRVETSGKAGLAQAPQAMIANSVASEECSPLIFPHQYIPGFVQELSTTPRARLRDLGSASINGNAAEHLQSVFKIGVSTQTADFYISKATHHWLRFGESQKSKDKKGHTILVSRFSYTYSRFNEKSGIKAPKIGASTP